MSQLKRPGAFVASEANGTLSRESGVIKALNDASTIYKPGRVLGRVTSPSISGAANGANTGNATIGSVTLSAKSQPGVPLPGVYKATCTDATHFTVTDPNGATCGTGVFGTAYDDGIIKFTVTAGVTPCVAGDYFNVTVAADAGKYVTLAPTATDGTQIAAAVLFDSADVSGASDVTKPVIVRNAEVKDIMLDWGTLNASQKLMATYQLASKGIAVRTTL